MPTQSLIPLKRFVMVSPLMGLLFGCQAIQPYWLAINQPQGAVYPERVTNNFLVACTAGRGKVAEEICLCTLKKVQLKYSLTALVQLERQLRAGSLPSEDLRETVESCQKHESQSESDSKPESKSEAKPESKPEQRH